ncbi:uncharacterized protein [Spinacia oleracea]|uniref:Uncharacterized protein isoform X2 n=1 Tax=Spinacia oleracea TaxID=3562 RepID=A0A9R0HWZ5_SPIOL|nr:uncharacterized protein LOC110778199 isoform X2 [Spinacia oleracea]
MPGTIHVSVLELVGLPSPPQSSSMGVKVSMGKQAHEMQDKESSSFALASLRDNLNVSIHDYEGNEIAHTDVLARSIVEKGTWDDSFPLKDGGHIRMRLHFILTEEELNRIRRMRESAARKKQEDLLKRSRSSSDLAGSSGDSLKSRYQTQERSVESTISADSDVEVLNKAQPGQKKQVFSTSKSTGALDKLPAYQQLKERIEGKNAEQQSDQLDKTPSNVRKTRLAFESSQLKEESHATNKTWETTQLSSSVTVDIPSNEPSLKKISTKPVSSKLETALNPSTSEEIGEERGKLLRATTNKTKKTAQLLSINTTVDTPSKVPILKKTVIFDTKPVLYNLESVPVPPTPEEIGKLFTAANNETEAAQLSSNTRVDTPSKEPIIKNIVAAVNSETAPAPATQEETGKERGELLLGNNKTEETDQLTSNKRADTPSKVPIVKKIVAENSEEIGKESSKLLLASSSTAKETAAQLSSNTAVDTPFKVPFLKKIVAAKSEDIGKESSKMLLASSTTAKETPQLSGNAAVDTPFKVPFLKKIVAANSEEIGKESSKLLLASSKTKETPQLRSNAEVDTPFKVPFLKKIVAATSETAPASSTSEEIGKESAKTLLASSSSTAKETAQLRSNAAVHTPFKVPFLKKMVAVNSETTPAPSTTEEIGKESASSTTKETDQLSRNTRVDSPFKVPFLQNATVAVNSETVLSNPETTAASENNEEIKTLRKVHTSPVSLKSLLEALPRRKQPSTNGVLGIEKKWRSKQWRLNQKRGKSKVLVGNEQCSIHSFRGWVFLDEMISPCVLDEPEGCISHCSQDNDQEKLKDTGNAQIKREKSSTESKKLESDRKPNNMSFNGPGGQVVKIAIMAGFGLLVLLTRQGK